MVKHLRSIPSGAERKHSLKRCPNTPKRECQKGPSMVHLGDPMHSAWHKIGAPYSLDEANVMESNTSNKWSTLVT